jgi:hypothetical protein
MKVRNVTVRIERQAGLTIEKVVPAWEVRVLNVIFGEPSVVQVGSEESELLDDLGQPKDFDAREQYETLQRRYGTATDSEGDKLLPLAYRDAYELDTAFQRMRAAWESAPKVNNRQPQRESAVQ